MRNLRPLIIILLVLAGSVVESDGKNDSIPMEPFIIKHPAFFPEDGKITTHVSSFEFENSFISIEFYMINRTDEKFVVFAEREEDPLLPLGFYNVLDEYLLIIRDANGEEKRMEPRSIAIDYSEVAPYILHGSYHVRVNNRFIVRTLLNDLHARSEPFDLEIHVVRYRLDNNEFVPMEPIRVGPIPISSRERK